MALVNGFASTEDQGPSTYVTLVSSDGFEFVVRRSAANVSGALRRMLDPRSTMPSAASEQVTDLIAGGFSEARQGRCVLENIKYVGGTFVELASLA